MENVDLSLEELLNSVGVVTVDDVDGHYFEMQVVLSGMALVWDTLDEQIQDLIIALMLKE